VPTEIATPPSDASALAVDAARGDAELEEPAGPHQPRVESQVPVDFGEQMRVRLPPGLSALQRHQFVLHTTAAAIPEAEQLRGFASCVEGRVFLHPGGVDGALREGAAELRCEGVDLALVADLDGDGLPDVAGIDARRGAVVVFGSRRMRVERSLPVPNAWGLVGGLTAGEGRRQEAAVVVYVAGEGAVPTLAAVGLRSGRVWWRADASLHVGAPGDYGLAVIADLDGDRVNDVVTGLLRDGRRCLTTLSGATGAPIWRAPRCAEGSAAQYVAAGPDTSEDRRADLAVAGASARRIEVLSGRDGSELLVVPPATTLSDHTLGQGMVLLPDLSRDGFADIATPSMRGNGSVVEVFSANDGHRIGEVPASFEGSPLALSEIRVQYVYGFVFAQSRSLLVATPGAVTISGAAPRPEDRANP
jgi:hypothetical protein